MRARVRPFLDPIALSERCPARPAWLRGSFSSICLLRTLHRIGRCHCCQFPRFHFHCHKQASSECHIRRLNWQFRCGNYGKGRGSRTRCRILHPTRHLGVGERREGRTNLEGERGREGARKGMEGALFRFNFASHSGICEQYLSAHKRDRPRWKGKATGAGAGASWRERRRCRCRSGDAEVRWDRWRRGVTRGSGVIRFATFFGDARTMDELQEAAAAITWRRVGR